MHTHIYIDCACADDLLPYVPFAIYTATGDVVKVVYYKLKLANLHQTMPYTKLKRKW